MSKIIAISIGNTYSKMALIVNDAPKMLPNERQQLKTKSIVYSKFKIDNSIQINNSLKYKTEATDDMSYICGYEPVFPQMESVPILRNLRDEIKNVSKESDYKATEVMLKEYLNYLKNNAQSYIGNKIHSVAFVVPDDYTDEDRSVLIRIADQIKLKTLAVKTESELMLPNENSTKKNVMVFNWGGHKLDLSIFELDKGKEICLEAVSIEHGYNKIDDDVRNYILKTIPEQLLNESNNLSTLKRINDSVEQYRKKWQRGENFEFMIPYFNQSSRKYEYHMIQVEADKVNKVIKKHIKKIENVIENFIQEIEISEIVMIGGGSNDIHIQDVLSEYTSKLTVDKYPEYAATLKLVQKTKELPEYETDITSADELPLSLGIAGELGITCELVPRGAKLPIRISKKFQRKAFIMLLIRFTLGERVSCIDNIRVQSYIIREIFSTEFMSEKRYVNLNIEIQKTGLVKLCIDSDTTVVKEFNLFKNLSWQDVERIQEDAENYKDMDEKILKIALENVEKLSAADSTMEKFMGYSVFWN